MNGKLKFVILLVLEDYRKEKGTKLFPTSHLGPRSKSVYSSKQSEDKMRNWLTFKQRYLHKSLQSTCFSGPQNDWYCSKNADKLKLY